jgi:hypothetical protein
MVKLSMTETSTQLVARCQVASLFNLPRLVELRWLGYRRLSLFTENVDVLHDALGSSAVAGLNTYLVINPLLADVVERHRAPRDLIFGPMKGQCSADIDVAHRDLIVLDLDPCRAVGTAATPQQWALALELAQQVIAYLISAGCPAPVAIIDSGNGIHIYFRAAQLANCRETDVLLTGFYHALARKFDTPAVHLDKSVRSAAQLMRLPGSVNHKAERLCEILSFTEGATPVTLDAIRKVTDELRGTLGLKKSTVVRRGSWSPELMERFLQFYCIDYLPPVEIAQGTLFVCNPCPLSADHRGSSPAVLVTKDGFPAWKCMHASCQMTWRQFRMRLYNETNKWFLTGSN